VNDTDCISYIDFNIDSGGASTNIDITNNLFEDGAINYVNFDVDGLLELGEFRGNYVESGSVSIARSLFRLYTNNASAAIYCRKGMTCNEFYTANGDTKLIDVIANLGAITLPMTSGNVFIGGKLYYYANSIMVGPTVINVSLKDNMITGTISAVGESPGWAIAGINIAENVFGGSTIISLSRVGDILISGNIHNALSIDVVNAASLSVIDNVGNHVGITPTLSILSSGVLGNKTKISGNQSYLTEFSGSSTGTGSEQTIAHDLAAIPTGCKAWITYLVGSRYVTEFVPFDATNIYPTVISSLAYTWGIGAI
jgi:hypothetical protein